MQKKSAINDSVSQKIDELRERSKEKFSEKEIDSFITMGKQLAGKAVLSLVIKCLGESPDADRIRIKKLIKKVKKRIPYDYSGFVQCGFKETPMLLNVSLSVVGADYRTDIDIPHASYAKDLFNKYDFLKSTARAYWRQFAEENPALFKSICGYSDEFNELHIDYENPTLMYFDQKSKYRIGIFCYYVDSNGHAFYKKKKDLI